MFNEKISDTFVSSVLDNIDSGVILKDFNGKVVFVNQTFEDLIGYSSEELVGLNNAQIIDLLIGADFVPDVQTKITQILEGQRVSERRKLTHKSGQRIPLEVKGAPVLNGEAIIGEMLIFKDLHQELLVKITQLVNSSLALEQVLQNTTQAAVEHLGLGSCAIFLLDEDKNYLRLEACNAFPSKEECNKVQFKLGEGPPGLIAQQKKALYVRNLRTDESLPEEARHRHSDKSSIGYPLICNDEVLGIVAFDADVVRDFSKREQVLFENVAGQVALAIYNAKLFTKLAHLSSTDGLTGLFNHRYFQERLEKEIQRAQRSNAYLSLLMIDVDNFKNYNDTFGHVNGDEVLKKIAELINDNVRTSDIAARYGGEEFAVILVECPKEESIKIANRIQQAIEGYQFYGREKQPGGKVTVSIGLAMYREPLSNKSLLQFADSALYQAKNYGRNRVEVYAS